MADIMIDPNVGIDLETGPGRDKAGAITGLPQHSVVGIIVILSMAP